MFVWIKRLLLLAFGVGILAAGSYAGARFQAGNLIGSKPPLGGRTIEFAFNGVETLRGNPRVWIVTYTSSRLPGVRRATIYVSLTGRIVATEPADLGDRIDDWERSLEP